MRAAAVVALLLHALPGAYGVAATTFVRVPEGLAYAEAEARCTQIGAAIASIHSAAENELARTACGDLTSCWLGLVETGGDAGTAAANQTWLWQDPPAGTALPAYTNWAAGEPDNAGGVDQRNAIIDTAGEWHDSGDGSLGLGYVAYPLCRVAGELNFTLDHNPAQCQVAWDEGRCRKLDSDEKCCAPPGRQACADLLGGTGDVVETYQLVETGEACKDENGNDSLEFKCYKCKAGKICDNGVERSLKDKPENNCHPCGGGCVAVIIIFFVILPLCCIGCSVAACCIACQQNNRRPQARVQQQPVAYAAAQPAGGAVQMQQYGKQPYQAGPPQAPVVVQPTVVRPTVVQPTVVQPTVVQPTVVRPTVVQGAVVQGTVVQGEIQREY